MKNTNYLGVLRLQHCKFNEFTFVSESQDVQPIKEALGKIASEFDAFFVRIENGDYAEVWGIHGSIPFTNKDEFKIK